MSGIHVHQDAQRVIDRFGVAASILKSFSAWVCVEVGGAIAVVMKKTYPEGDRGLFGFIDFPNDPDVSQLLFAAMEAEAKKLGVVSLTGPINYGTWLGYKWKTGGFDIDCLLPDSKNGPEVPRRAEELGFAPKHHYTSALIDLQSELYYGEMEACVAHAEERGFAFEFVDGPAYRSTLDDLYEITAAAFAVPLYCRVQKPYFEDVTMSYLKDVAPVVALCRYEGKVCGYSVNYALPAKSEWWITPMVAVLAPYRRNHVGTALFHMGHRAAKEAGATHSVHHVRWDQNVSTRCARDARLITSYALYGKDLK